MAATNRQLRETICERWSSVKAVAFLEASARNSSAALPRRSASVSFAQHSSINALVVLRSLAAARGVVWASAIADIFLNDLCGAFAQGALWSSLLIFVIALLCASQIRSGLSQATARWFCSAASSAYSLSLLAEHKLGLACKTSKRPSKVLLFIARRPPSVQTLPAVDFTSPTAAKSSHPELFGSASQELSDAPDSSHEVTAA